MFKKTFEGFSLAETLISLALLSLLVIVYSNISAFQHVQNNRESLIKMLFTEAHSIAGILEDKRMEEIPLSLFSSSNPLGLPFLANTNHTVTMSMSEFASKFALVLPNEIAGSKHVILCIYSPLIFGEIQYNQMSVYVCATYEKRVLYGYASYIF